MPSLIILGASGFLGRAFISSCHLPMHAKAVARRAPPDAELAQMGITWVAADLSEPTALNDIVGAGDIVINLAYMPDASEAENISLIDNVVEACIRCRATRLIHCSTAVVVGATRASRVTESTPCTPLTPYEQTKLKIEQRVLGAVPSGIDVAILRPTAIVGQGGQNLLKLARSLQSGNRAVNYLRASLFGRRPMHLVPVHNVAAALLHLAVYPEKHHGSVYIVASDDDANNNFQSVEEILSRSLGLKSRAIPVCRLPKQMLLLLLKLMGRSEVNMDRFYDSRKLLSTNFKPVSSLVMAIHEFAEKAQLNE